LLALLYAAGGLPGLVYGGLLSIIVVWHVAFAITVMLHTLGKPAYETHDESKNSLFLALLTFGEGWHNNHHANMASARLGHERTQIDIGYWVFLGLERVGLIWDLKKSIEPRFYKRVSPPLGQRPTQIATATPGECAEAA